MTDEMMMFRTAAASHFRQTTMPTTHQSILTDRMLFLTPNQQHQRTEGSWQLL